jgi:hypothetical protein
MVRFTSIRRAIVAATIGVATLAVVAVQPAAADGPSALGVSGWQVYGSTAVFANPVASTQIHGTPGQYAAAPAVPAQTDPGWADCGATSPLRSSPYSATRPLCPSSSTIGMAVGSILPACWNQLNFTYFQALVSIPTGTDVTQFSVNMSGADDGARVSLVNSAYPGGVTPPGGFIYQLTGQATGDLSAFVVAGEVNRVVITQVDDCATGNNLNSARVFLNGSVIPPVADTDHDGVPDTSDNCVAVANADQLNTDGDSQGNACDADDDNDGVLDGSDAFPLDAGESVDTDHDGTGNSADADDDGDNVADADDAFPLDAGEQIDTDGDGVGDNADTDDDGDGVADVDDAFSKDAAETADSDGDGIGDNADTDDDQDGIADTDDAFPLDAAETADSDHDGIGDNADADDDNDGVADADDAFPRNPAESVDTDHDGTGNNADTDDDGDSVADADDAFPLDPAESLDTDHDGTGNNADADDDNDGLADVDEGPAHTNPLIPDTDGDGTLDGADTLPLDPKVGAVPADGDGICSVVKRFATKNGASVSLCNHLDKAQGYADRHDARGFTSAMSTFDKELTAQTNGKNAAISLADAVTIRALAAVWLAHPW